MVTDAMNVVGKVVFIDGAFGILRGGIDERAVGADKWGQGRRTETMKIMASFSRESSLQADVNSGSPTGTYS
jgi:hypothetical protein